MIIGMLMLIVPVFAFLVYLVSLGEWKVVMVAVSGGVYTAIAAHFMCKRKP